MLFGGIALVCLIFIGLIIRLWLNIKAEEKEPDSPPVNSLIFGPSVNITAFEIEKLSNIAYIEQLDALLRQANIEQRLPAFYEKYTGLNKVYKEHYLENLLMLFAKGKKSELDKFLKEYTELSVQDTLMMFMLDAGFDNKSIARMLWINHETFKKRKSRLKAKCKKLNIPFEFKRANADEPHEPLVGE